MCGLYFGPILDWGGFGRGMLWLFGWWMLVLVELLLNKARHMCVYITFIIIPIQFDAYIKFLFPVYRYIIVFS